MLWNPKNTDVGRVWGLRLSDNELVFSVSLRFDALLQTHTALGAQYRDRWIKTERWMVGKRHFGVDGVFERRSARYGVDYRMNIDHLTSVAAAHAVVTFGHCFRVLDLLGDETLGMEVSDPQHWWLEHLELAGMGSAIQVSVTPAAAEQIDRMDERLFQLIVPVIIGVCSQTLGPGGTRLVRAERGSTRTPFLMVDGDCTCFGAGGEAFQPGRGYELNSHNFRYGTHLLATLSALAHLSTVMDNTRIN